MSKLPSMPLFVDVFVSDTVHLSNEQMGMYIRLLFFAWNKNGDGIPDDSELINRVCLANTEKEQDIAGNILNEFFELRVGETPEENSWHNKRLEKEWNYTIDLVKKRSFAGTKGSTKRQQNANKTSTPRPTPTPTPIPIYKYIDLFNMFWEKIDNKIGKGQAEKTFCKGESFYNLQSLDEAEKWVVKMAELYNSHCQEKKEFAQHPSTWLNAKGYEDKPMDFQEKPKDNGFSRERNYKDYVGFVKRGQHTTWLSNEMVRQMLKEGLISEEESKNYGV